MRTGLTLQQTNILSANIKKVAWLFDVTLPGHSSVDYRWSTAAKIFNGQAYTFKIMGFDPITLNMGSPESGVIPPTETTIRVSFSNSTIDGLYASNFKGASVTIRLVCGAWLEPVPAEGDTDEVVATPDYQEVEIMAWRFKVLSSSSVDQIMTWKLQDFFTLYLEGDYPNTPLVSDLFRADIMKADNVRVPLAFGQPFFPIRWIPKNTTAVYVDADTFTVVGDQTALFSTNQYLLAFCGNDGAKSCWVSTSSCETGMTIVNLTAASADLTVNLATIQTDHYLLGVSGPTYTIDRARTPIEQSGKTIYLPVTYTFKQDTVTGSDSVSYRVVQLLIDGANAYWGVIGSEMYDMPLRFSRSDLVTMTSPPNIAEYIWESWGIPSSEIDAVSQAAAAATYAARDFELNIGLWYQQPREKLIAKLFSISGMIPVIRDTIGFKILTKVPQLILEEDLIQPGSFSIAQAGYTRTQTDSGYVTWQIGTEPIVQVNKSLVACKTTTAKKSDTTIECDWILDAVKAQKSGKLALQRSLLKDQTITFTAQAKILQLEPGDMISINPANLGAEGTVLNCLIDKMTLREDLWIDVECTKFSAELDDWDDLSISDIVVSDANTDKAYTPVYQGPGDANGNGSNEIKNGAVLLGNNGEFKTNIAPATNGGFVATNTSLTCYNSTGGVRFQAKYGADADAGDVILGNYAGGQGAKWKQSTGLFDIAGGISATTGTIAGWLIVGNEIKKITSNAGITLDSSIPALKVTDANGYERVLLGKSGANYGLTVKDEANKTIININDTNKNIAGWTVDDGKMYNTNSYISSASYISFGNTPPTAYGNNAGVWMGWTAGLTAKAQLSLYTDANNYFQFDGSKILIKAANFTLDASGNITASNVTVSGAITISSGSGYGNLTDKPTALSGINSGEGTKLSGIATGATVGAAWGTNLSGRPTELTDGRITTALNASGVLVSKVIPATAVSPSGAGLYLGSDYMGYYSGSAWKSFMKNDSTFQFNGDADNYISWNGATLTVRGGLTADDITSGVVSARTFQTAGTRLTQATVGSDSTIYVADTSLFPPSGYGWIYDTTIDVFAYTGKTGTTLTGCTGVSVTPHASGLAVGGQFKRMIVSSLDNEMHFFGDHGGGTIEELASIGIKTDGGDTVIGYFGSVSAGNSKSGVYGLSDTSYGVYGNSNTYVGVKGFSNTGYGGIFDTGVSGKGNIQLYPSSSASAPTHEADIGAIWMTSTGIPYHNMVGSTMWYETVLASLKGEFVWNPVSLATGERTYIDVAVTGAVFGDFVLVCAPYDLALMTVTVFVSAIDQITVRLLNTTESTHNLAEGTWRYKIIKY